MAVESQHEEQSRSPFCEKLTDVTQFVWPYRMSSGSPSLSVPSGRFTCHSRTV